MARNKVFFHGPGTGIGDMMRELNDAGIPFLIKSLEPGFAAEAAAMTVETGIDNTIVLRFTNPGVPPGGEVPPYWMQPEDAAQIWFDKTMQSINAAPELEPYKSYIWIEVMNELRTKVTPDDDPPMWNDMHPVDWLGYFAREMSNLLNDEGYKHMAFGMNSGEPEPKDWWRPGMVSFLEDAARNIDQVGVSLHEYDWDMVGPEHSYPYWWGRFEELHKACDEMDIARPTIVISEFGWALGDIPAHEIAKGEIYQYAELIAQYPNIKGAAIWRLDGDNGKLRGKVSRLMPWITEFTKNVQFPDPVEQPPIEPPVEPPPDPEPPLDALETFLWHESIATQCISLNRSAGLQSIIFDDGLIPVGTEHWVDYGPVQYAYMAAERLIGQIERRVYYTEVPKWDNIKYISSLETPTKPPPIVVPPPQPAPNQVDMAGYFFPTGGEYSPIFTMSNNWGGGNERIQLQRDGDISYITKNQQWEKKLIGREYIRSLIDTSPGNNEFYAVLGTWMPREWVVGDRFTRTEEITFFRKSDCQTVPGKPSYTQTSELKFADRFTNYKSPSSPEIVLNDIIKIQWILSGIIEETYWYARGLGLVEWFARDGRHSYIVELIPVGSQENNVREVINCL